MKEISLYVWWSAGSGDGDGYDEEYELEEEEYNLLRKYLRNGDAPEDIPELKELWDKINDDLSDSLRENSQDGFEANGGEDEYEESFEDWYDSFDTGVELRDEYLEPENHTFTINIEDSGESELEFGLYEDEIERLDQLEDDEEEFESLEDDEEYSYLYEEIMNAAKKNILEDLESEDEEIDVEELAFSINY